MVITIQPYRWEDLTGSHSAECYPFVDGEPCPALAHCSRCVSYLEEETCSEWVGKENEAPLFCGPICHKFRVV